MFIEGGLCSGTGAAAFNGMYVESIKCSVFGHKHWFYCSQPMTVEGGRAVTRDSA